MKKIRSLKEYEKKYKSKNHKQALMKFSKKEVEAFDKEANTIGKNYVLRHRKWVLIGDTYYEIPKPIRWSWFKGLNAGTKIATCALLGGIVAGGSYGVYYAALQLNSGMIVDITGTGSGIIENLTFTKDSNGDYVAPITFKSGHTSEEIDMDESYIKVDGVKLTYQTDYDIKEKNADENLELVIYKHAIKSNKCKIEVYIKKQGEVTISLNEEEAELKVGDTLQLEATVTGTSKSVSWESSSDVCTVDEDGLVTAVKAGEANIIATVANKSAVCKVTVVAATSAVNWATTEFKSLDGTLQAYCSKYQVVEFGKLSDHDISSEFITSEKISGLDVGLSDKGKVFLYCGILKATSQTAAYILSDNKICFEDAIAQQGSFFSNYATAISIKLNNLDTSNVTSLSSAFHGCSALTSIDLSNLDVSKVTQAVAMFYQCTSLSTVNLANWKPTKLKNADGLFDYCSSLKTIFADKDLDLSKSSGISGDCMFRSCTSLVGGEGTAYVEKYQDNTYAVVDQVLTRGPSALGYFTIAPIDLEYNKSTPSYEINLTGLPYAVNTFRATMNIEDMPRFVNNFYIFNNVTSKNVELYQARCLIYQDNTRIPYDFGEGILTFSPLSTKTGETEFIFVIGTKDEIDDNVTIVTSYTK